MILQYGKPQSQSWLGKIMDYLWGIFPAGASIFLCIALWQFVHNQMGAMIMPDPVMVFRRVGEIIAGVEQQHLLMTLWRGTLAVVIAIISGCLLGFLAGSFRTIAVIFRPLNTLLLGIPPIIWVVLAIFWFDMGNLSVMFTVWIVVLPLVFASAQMSLISVPESLKEMVKVYLVPFRYQLTKLYIPHILRQMLPALIVAVGSGLKVTVMAELLGSSDGIGSKIAEARAMLDTTDVMAYVVLIVLIIMAIEYGILEPFRRYFVTGEQNVKAR